MFSLLATVALCYIQWRAIKEIKSLTKKINNNYETYSYQNSQR